MIHIGIICMHIIFCNVQESCFISIISLYQWMDVVTITNYVIYYAKKLNNLEMEKHVMYKIEFWYRFILQYDFFFIVNGRYLKFVYVLIRSFLIFLPACPSVCCTLFFLSLNLYYIAFRRRRFSVQLVNGLFMSIENIYCTVVYEKQKLTSFGFSITNIQI